MADVRSRETTLLDLIRKVDPDWQRERQREVEHTMSNGRVFTGRTAERGPYAPDLDHVIGLADGFGIYTSDGRKLVYR